MALTQLTDYFRSYDRDVYSVFAQQGAEPAESDLLAFESRTEFDLPSEFREYVLHPLGGLYMEAKETHWPRAEKLAVGPFWSFLYGFFVYSLSPDCPDWMGIESAWEEMCAAGHPELLPFLRVIGDADPYCFTRDGRIVIWRHETPDEPDPVRDGFTACVLKEIRELERRTERKLRGEDRSA